MTKPQRPLDYRDAAADARAQRPVRLLMTVGSFTSAGLVFVAGLVLFIWLDQSDLKAVRETHVLRLAGAVLVLPMAACYAAVILLWPRRHERPFVTGSFVGSAVTLGFLAVWGIIL